MPPYINITQYESGTAIPIGAVAGLPVHRVHRVGPAHDVVHAGVVPGWNQ